MSKKDAQVYYRTVSARVHHVFFSHINLKLNMFLPGGGGVGGLGGEPVTGGRDPQYNRFACNWSFLLRPYR